MQNTMNLLADAEQMKDLSAWAEVLGLTKRALYTAKYRGNLSPAIAGALAEEMGRDPKRMDSDCSTGIRTRKHLQAKNDRQIPKDHITLPV